MHMGRYCQKHWQSTFAQEYYHFGRKINKEIYEDSEDYSLKNKEFSLSSSESSYEYFSIASDDNSPTTVHVNNEHSMPNESEISNDFNGTESYDQEQQRNLDT